MNYVILYGAIQSFFMALIIFNKKKKSVADYILGIWLLLIGFHILSFFIYINNIHSQQEHILDLNIAFPLLNGPLLYNYVYVLIHENNKFRVKNLLHFLPFLIFVFFLTHDLFIYNEETLRYYDSIVLTKNSTMLLWFLKVLIILSMPVYIVWCLNMLKHYRKQLKNNFSYIEKITLNWLRYIIFGFGIVWLTVFVLHFNIHPLESLFVNQIVFSSYTVFVFFIGYNGFRHSLVFSNVNSITFPERKDNNSNDTEEPVKEKYKQSGLKEKEAVNIHKQLIKFMETEKPYTDNTLTLTKLSEKIGISPFYLSQVLNEQQKQNFYDFINSYRVEEFKKQICDPKNKNFTLLSVAYECGFNSKASFNRIFKNQTGKVPSQYKADIMKE